MALYLLISAVIIFSCVAFKKISSKLGIPVLLAFIFLGMLFGSDGLVRIPFSDYNITEQICSVALIFIMFYGGFGANWREARPVAVKAVVLSSFGTVITAGLVGLFCRFVLGIALLESFLIGAVISSTDAASMFSILRSQRLNLKYGTASLLEVESGSNDPFSYMLTVIVLSLMNGGVSGGGFVWMLIAQVVFGAVAGVAAALAGIYILRRVKFSSDGFDAIFIVGIAVAAYALPTLVGGNGYLSAYIAGIILGNSRIGNKKALVNFFDAATGMMQMLLFFLLGLISFPSQLPGIALLSLIIALFLTFVARPLAVFALLSPFRSNIRQQLLVSWAGMRGAASIVFAMMAVVNPAVTDNDIFHIVFFIVLFSILLQGSLLPVVAKRLGMTDETSDVMKTFTDYSDEVPVQFIQFTVSPSHPWSGAEIQSIILPPDSILVLLIRNGEKIIPNGRTGIRSGDTLVLSGKATGVIDGIKLYEKTVVRGDDMADKPISGIPSGDRLIIMIRRGEEVIIPRGDTVLRDGDIIVTDDIS